MTKPNENGASRKAKTGKTTVRGHEVLGTTSDGVRILRPRPGATHFSAAELRKAIAEVLESKKAG